MFDILRLKWAHRATIHQKPIPSPKSHAPVVEQKRIKMMVWRSPLEKGKGYSDTIDPILQVLQDNRDLMIEVRDAVKENTAFLKQVYGDPKDD